MVYVSTVVDSAEYSSVLHYCTYILYLQYLLTLARSIVKPIDPSRSKIGFCIGYDREACVPHGTGQSRSIFAGLGRTKSVNIHSAEDRDL